MYTRLHTCLNTCLHTCLNTCLHTCLHTCLRTGRESLKGVRHLLIEYDDEWQRIVDLLTIAGFQAPHSHARSRVAVPVLLERWEAPRHLFGVPPHLYPRGGYAVGDAKYEYTDDRVAHPPIEV